MFDFLFENKLLAWCGFIFIALPIAIFILYGIMRGWSKNKPINKPLLLLRNLILPLLIIDLTFVKIIGFDLESLPVRVTDTFLWISIITAALSFLNNVIFGNTQFFKRKEQVPKLARDLIQFILILLGTAFILSIIWRFDLGNLITALGVSSLVLGLALQDTLSNLFTGIALLYAKPFTRGDWIKVGENIGRVQEINWRATYLVNRHEELIVIPNTNLSKETFINYSRPKRWHSEEVRIGFAYDHNPKKVKVILQNLAAQTEGVLEEPAPFVITCDYKDFSIEYSIRFFIKNYQSEVMVKDELMTNIWEAAKKEGLKIPYPIREIHTPEK